MRSVALAVAWLVVMLVYSPAADALATRLVRKPPNLEAFRGLQQSRAKLVLGIVLAWLVGGVLEESLLRGLLLPAVAAWVGTAAAVVATAGVAGVVHLYQGARAAIVVGQLSVLFGVLYVVSGGDLVAVVVCHGLYDTIAFVRFAQRKSKYST